ncbi:MAG: phosphohistidine phosphatase SixA [Polaribacter sp.]|jgi:phosphohistidine phosphatase SixA
MYGTLMFNKMISTFSLTYMVFLFSCLFINLSFISQTTAYEMEAHQTSQFIYLTRHAEKDKSVSKDPHLTKKGRLRAKNLVKMFLDKDIKRIYSTKYARTLETANPSSIKLGLNIQTYDPRNLKQFAELLLSTPGNTIIIGHSNTTPNLVNLLGGIAGANIEESEYDRVYKLRINHGKVETEILRSSASQLR